MQAALKRAGFELYCGVGGPALAAIDAFLAGQLVQSDATCGHHHGDCH
jgi:predicted Fe-Mo cluster-binding NifX family protein